MFEPSLHLRQSGLRVLVHALTCALVAIAVGATKAAAQLIITNPTGTVWIHPNQPLYSVTFTVDNETGSSGSWAVTCGFTAPVNSCTAPASTGTIANGAIKMVSVSYTVSGTGTGSVTINIGAGLATGNRIVIISIPNPTITPTGTTITTTPYTDSSYTFTVTNSAGASETYQITPTCTGTALDPGCSVSQTSVTLAASASTNVTLYYRTLAAGSSGTIGLALVDDGYNFSNAVTVNAGFGAGAPRINPLPFVADLQDLTRCATSCFTASFAQGSVPYISLDLPRNVVLAYNESRVIPRPFVHVDVSPDPGTAGTPLRYELQLKFGVGATAVTFVNGETVLKFSSPAGNPVVRIGGQFDASNIVTYAHGSVYPLEIWVTAVYSGSSFTAKYKTQYLSVNEVNNGVARGWTVAGVQRAFGQTDGSVLILEGNGNAVYFKKIGTVLKAPPGEFSTLTGTGPWTRTYVDGTAVSFSATGYLTQVADRWSNATTITYDGSNRVSLIKDPLLSTTTLTYGANGLATIVDPASRTTTITVAANRTLTQIQDTAGMVTTLGYDASLRLATIQDPNLATTTLAYDANATKTVSTITAPSVPIFGGGSSAPVTTLSSWQLRGVPFAPTAVTPLASPGADTIWARVTEPGGTVNTYQVDRWGQPKVIVNALAEQATVTYSAEGLLVKAVMPGYPGGVFDTTAYNANGLPIYAKAAASSATTVTYGVFGQVATTVGTGQPSMTYTLGGHGEILNVQAAGQIVQKITAYDTFGRAVTIKDANDTTVATMTYQPTGLKNLQQVQQPGNRLLSYGYDAAGRVRTVTRPLAVAESTYYDRLNRPTVVATTIGGVRSAATYEYDNIYLRGTIAPNGTRDSTYYNALGWPTKHRDQAGANDLFEYSLDGDLKKVTTRRLKTLSFLYDALHRVTQRTGDYVATWGYSTNGGWIVRAGSPYAVDSIFSNARGQPDSVVTILGGVGVPTQTYRRKYAYILPGLLDTVGVTGPAGVTFASRKYGYNTGRGSLTSLTLGGRQTLFTLDGNYRPTSIKYPALDTVGTSFGNLGLPEKVIAGNGTGGNPNYGAQLNRWLGQDGVGRLSQQLFRNDGTGQEGRFFQFDSLGQLRVRRDQHTTFVPPVTCPDPNFGMLFAGCQPGGGSGWTTDTTKTYAYDLGGNRTDNGGTYTGNRITAFNNCTYTTDADGNVTGRSGGSCAAGAASFFWNAEGQLDSVQTGATGVKYLYDAAGRLVFKRVNNSPAAFQLWDGGNPLADLNGLASAKTTEYSYFPGLDSPHAFIWSGRTWYPHRDAVGNVIVTNDSLGGPDRTYQYDDWGKLSGGADGFPFSGADRLRWKGALWYGNEANLYYLRNRWYDPETGRFLSEDPLGVDAGMNLYSFAGSDPVDGSDPTGLYRLGNVNVVGHTNWGNPSLASWLIDTWYRNMTEIGARQPGGRPPGELQRSGGGARIGARAPAARLCSNAVSFVGVAALVATPFVGVGVAFGVFSDPTTGDRGIYLRLTTLAIGIDAGVGGEFGRSQSQQAFAGPSQGFCRTAAFVSGCKTSNPSGVTKSISIAKGPLPVPVSGHYEESTTWARVVKNGVATCAP